MIQSNIDNELLIKELTKVVLDFTSRMNLWETKIYYCNRIQCGEYVKQEYYNKYKDLKIEVLYGEYIKIIEETCVIRDRVYGGNPLTASFGKPPKYNGIEESTITELILIKEDKVEIIAKGGDFSEQYIKFVLFEKKGVWRIDQLFSRRENTEWTRKYI